MNQKVKKLSLFDLKLIKWSTFFFAPIILKLFPRILNIRFPAMLYLLTKQPIRPDKPPIPV
jgi:hypothetical protein